MVELGLTDFFNGISERRCTFSEQTSVSLEPIYHLYCIFCFSWTIWVSCQSVHKLFRHHLSGPRAVHHDDTLGRERFPMMTSWVPNNSSG